MFGVFLKLIDENFQNVSQGTKQWGLSVLPKGTLCCVQISTWDHLVECSYLQRCHRYYPKFPELYSHRINSLIITALKYGIIAILMFNKGYILLFSKPFPPFLINYFYLETLCHFSWSSFFLSQISWFQEISWKVASLYLIHWAPKVPQTSRFILLKLKHGMLTIDSDQHFHFKANV